VDWAEWRPYRHHLIVAGKGGLLGRRCWAVWQCGSLVGTFGDVVSAELHVDARLREITR